MKKILKLLFFIGIVSLYAAIRVPALLAHYVAYTYDQGRDFIAGANILLTHHIPFIGPTTGINGLFHGSWWYYLLTVPFVLFKGSPIGFYWFNYVIQLLSLVVLIVFLNFEFKLTVAVLFGLLVAIAPYFTFSSLFVGNNIMVLPALFTFLIGNYYVFKNKQVSPLLLLIVGLSLGFVGEFELSFGIFLIPLYFLAIILFFTLRKKILQKKGLCFLLGLFITLIPRILFELKNSFSQTKVLFSFLFHPKLYNNPSPYLSILSERIILFKGYYFDIFTEKFFAYVFLFSMIFLFIITLISIKKKISSSLWFYLYLLFGLFFLSTFYKDFFWKNYYEGIQYIFLFIFITVIGEKIQAKYIVTKRAILFSIVFVLCILSGVQMKTTIEHKPPFDGLQVQEAIVNHLVKNQAQNQEYCVRIYTPSVIPHTYNYLFLVRKMKPSSEWINGACWFIVEADSFKERRQAWLDTNEPKDKHTVVVKKIKDVEVRYYKLLPQ